MKFYKHIQKASWKNLRKFSWENLKSFLRKLRELFEKNQEAFKTNSAIQIFVFEFPNFQNDNISDKNVLRF